MFSHSQWTGKWIVLVSLLVDGGQCVHHQARQDQLRGPGRQWDDEEDAQRGQDPGGGEQYQQESHGSR